MHKNGEELGNKVVAQTKSFRLVFLFQKCSISTDVINLHKSKDIKKKLTVAVCVMRYSLMSIIVLVPGKSINC